MEILSKAFLPMFENTPTFALTIFTNGNKYQVFWVWRFLSVLQMWPFFCKLRGNFYGGFLVCCSYSDVFLLLHQTFSNSQNLKTESSKQM